VPSPRAARLALAGLSAFVLLGALSGGACLVAWPRDGGPLRMPPEWMTGTLFGSYRLPGLVLLLAVGGSAAVSLVGLLGRRPWARPAALSAGAILLAWIAVQIAILGLVHPLQPLLGAVGAALVGSALRWRDD
jgi:hypothetical protein